MTTWVSQHIRRDNYHPQVHLCCEYSSSVNSSSDSACLCAILYVIKCKYDKWAWLQHCHDHFTPYCEYTELRTTEPGCRISKQITWLWLYCQGNLAQKNWQIISLEESALLLWGYGIISHTEDAEGGECWRFLCAVHKLIINCLFVLPIRFWLKVCVSCSWAYYCSD